VQKGFMPARDQITGELVGQVPTNHPKVLSGVWAHHHKGIKRSLEFCEKRSKGSKGKGNSNYKEFSAEEIWEHLNEYTNKNLVKGHIFFNDWLLECIIYLKEKYKFKKLSVVSILNRLDNKKPKEIIAELNANYHKCVIYDKWAKRKLKGFLND
jgi:hypothetical protein